MKTEWQKKYADECSYLANQRFGLEVLAHMLLEDLNCCANTVEKIITLAKEREFTKMQMFINDVKNSEAHFVTIKHITSAMRAPKK